MKPKNAHLKGWRAGIRAYEAQNDVPVTIDVPPWEKDEEEKAAKQVAAE